MSGKPVELLSIRGALKKFQLAVKVNGCRISIGTFQLDNICHGFRDENSQEL